MGTAKAKTKQIMALNNYRTTDIFPRHPFYYNNHYFLGVQKGGWQEEEDLYDALEYNLPTNINLPISQAVTNLSLTAMFDGVSPIYVRESADEVAKAPFGFYKLTGDIIDQNVNLQKILLVPDSEDTEVVEDSDKREFVKSIELVTKIYDSQTGELYHSSDGNGRSSPNQILGASVPISFIPGNYVAWAALKVVYNDDIDTLTPKDYTLFEEHMYIENGIEYFYDPFYNIGRVPLNPNNSLRKKRREIVQRNLKKDRDDWAKFLVYPTPKFSEWSALKIKISNDNTTPWTYNPEVCSAIGPSLYKMEKNSLNIIDAINSDPLARAVTTALYLDKDITDISGTNIIVPANNYLLAGIRSTRYGLTQAIWSLDLDFNMTLLATGQVISTAFSTYNYLFRKPNKITIKRDGTVLIASQDGLYEFVRTNSETTPIYTRITPLRQFIEDNIVEESEEGAVRYKKASLVELPGGYEMNSIGDDFSVFTPYNSRYGSLPQYFQNSLLYIRDNKIQLSDGTLYDGYNCGAEWLNTVWGIYQDNILITSREARQFLVNFKTDGWAKKISATDSSKLVYDYEVNFLRKDELIQKLVKWNNKLCIFGKKSDEFSNSGSLTNNVEASVFYVYDGLFLRKSSIDYRVLKATTSIQENGTEKLLVVAKKVSNFYSLEEENYYIIEIESEALPNYFKFSDVKNAFQLQGTLAEQASTGLDKDNYPAYVWWVGNDWVISGNPPEHDKTFYLKKEVINELGIYNVYYVIPDQLINLFDKTGFVYVLSENAFCKRKYDLERHFNISDFTTLPLYLKKSGNYWVPTNTVPTGLYLTRDITSSLVRYVPNSTLDYDINMRSNRSIAFGGFNSPWPIQKPNEPSFIWNTRLNKYICSMDKLTYEYGIHYTTELATYLEWITPEFLAPEWKERFTQPSVGTYMGKDGRNPEYVSYEIMQGVMPYRNNAYFNQGLTKTSIDGWKISHVQQPTFFWSEENKDLRANKLTLKEECGLDFQDFSQIIYRQTGGWKSATFAPENTSFLTKSETTDKIIYSGSSLPSYMRDWVQRSLKINSTERNENDVFTSLWEIKKVPAPIFVWDEILNAFTLSKSELKNNHGIDFNDLPNDLYNYEGFWTPFVGQSGSSENPIKLTKNQNDGSILYVKNFTEDWPYSPTLLENKGIVHGGTSSWEKVGISAPNFIWNSYTKSFNIHREKLNLKGVDISELPQELFWDNFNNMWTTDFDSDISINLNLNDSEFIEYQLNVDSLPYDYSNGKNAISTITDDYSAWIFINEDYPFMVFNRVTTVYEIEERELFKFGIKSNNLPNYFAWNSFKWDSSATQPTTEFWLEKANLGSKTIYVPNRGIPYDLNHFKYYGETITLNYEGGTTSEYKEFYKPYDFNTYNALRFQASSFDTGSYINGQFMNREDNDAYESYMGMFENSGWKQINYSHTHSLPLNAFIVTDVSTNRTLEKYDKKYFCVWYRFKGEGPEAPLLGDEVDTNLIFNTQPINTSLITGNSNSNFEVYLGSFNKRITFGEIIFLPQSTYKQIEVLILAPVESFPIDEIPSIQPIA